MNIDYYRSVSYKQQERDELAKDVAAFIESGGTIQQVDGFTGSTLREAKHPEPIQACLTKEEKAVYDAYQFGVFGVNEISKTAAISRTAVQKARDSLLKAGVVIKITRGQYRIANSEAKQC